MADIQLPESAMTSAGIFDAQGRLIRTLWNGQRREQGRLSIRWDGRDDEGHEVIERSGYVARVLVHHVQYRWQGVIGNTSQDQTGAHLFRGYLPIQDMAFGTAGDGFYVVGYNEGQAGIHRFSALHPQRQTALAHPDFRRVFRYVATDGRLVYAANVGLPAARPGDIHDAHTFVIALNAADGTEHVFAAGRRVGSSPDSAWQSVVDFAEEEQDTFGRLRQAATALAVQRHGSALFVAHAGSGEVRVFDKDTGALTGRISLAGVDAMDVAPDDSLWVLCHVGAVGTVRHLRNRDGSWVEEGGIAAGLLNPAALAVSPVDGAVAVVDAGSGQIKVFDGAGHLTWTIGREGGYRRGGPDVTQDRFGFSGGPVYIAFQADGSLWFADPQNLRNLHYSAQRRYLGQVMYLPHTQVIAVDAQDPRRVFSGYLEFAVDYSKPLASSWHLARNWGADLDARYKGDFEGPQAVVTLPGGHTFAVVRRFDINRNEIVELTRAGLRSVGTTIDFNTKLYPDGSLRQHAIVGQRLQIYSRRFDGLDASGNPRWADFAVLGRVPALAADDPYYHDVPLVSGVNEATYPQTSRGIIVSFNPGKSAGFHLGGIDPTRDGWLWRASPSGSWNVDAAGSLLPRDGRYDIAQGVQYPGNVVTVSGTQVVFGYHGEGWRGGEADQWLHFSDDGLFVGQFGTPGLPNPASQRGEAVAGFAGNAFSPQLVTVDGQVYLWHNDESGHGGVHRWWLKGAEAIRVFEAPIQP